MLVAVAVSIPSRALPRIRLLTIRVLDAVAIEMAPFVPTMSRIVLLSMIVPVLFVTEMPEFEPEVPVMSSPLMVMKLAPPEPPRGKRSWSSADSQWPTRRGRRRHAE